MHNSRVTYQVVTKKHNSRKKKPFNFFLIIPATDYHATPLDWEAARVNEAVFSTPVDLGTYLSSEDGSESTCPTRSSVLGLAVTCALMVVLYVCSIFCFCMKRAVARSGSKSGRDYLR